MHFMLLLLSDTAFWIRKPYITLHYSSQITGRIFRPGPANFADVTPFGLSPLFDCLIYVNNVDLYLFHFLSATLYVRLYVSVG